MTKRLLIVQPYIPAYRVPLFQNLKESLSAVGIELAIAAPRAQGLDLFRNDDHTEIIADFVLESRVVKLGRRKLFKKDLRGVLHTFDPDMIIVEQAIKNLEAWSLAFNPRLRRRLKTAMWGQGRSYSSHQSQIEAKTKQWLTRQMDWFFSYTQNGAEYVIEKGFPRDRVTVLNNSTDTLSLQNALTQIPDSQVESYLHSHGLTRGKVGLFLGGVDERKGIPFLMESANRIAQSCPQFRLLVAGDGEMAAEVKEQQERGAPFVFLGRVDIEQKALAFRAADLILIPEWIGLVAVESLAARVPIVTTEHSSHSPEVEYLTHGSNALFVDHDPQIYAESIIKLLGDRAELDRLSRSCEIDKLDLSIESMTKRFVSGIEAWIEIQGTQ